MSATSRRDAKKEGDPVRVPLLLCLGLFVLTASCYPGHSDLHFRRVR